MAMVEEHLFAIDDPRVGDIFEYWREVMGKNRGTVLDHKRTARIEWALAHYDEETVRKAIHGCSLSTWHMGANNRRRKYNDLELILRSAHYVEQFLEIDEVETTGATELEEWVNE